MRPVQELIHREEPAWPLVQELATQVPGRCVVHPASADAETVLYQTQVTTRSPLGAIAYHSGGISIDHGWLRILGSGSPAISRTLPGWNKGRARGCYLVADDAVGGFFAIDGGGLGLCQCEGQICYLSPKSASRGQSQEWEPLGVGYSGFLQWACTGFGKFYDDLRWPGWEAQTEALGPDRCFFFSPPLWAKDCDLAAGPGLGSRGGVGVGVSVPVEEAWGMRVEVGRFVGGR
ncbi:MAG: DUF2625 family protein [Verrucomicrobium sp.]